VSHLREYLAELIRRTSSVLDDQLVGVYLYGSAAMDAFVPSRSDVDVLVVTTPAVAAEARHTLAEALSPIALPCPGVGLELSVVTSASARTPSDAPAFELHIETQDGLVVDGLGHPGDPDLVAHFGMARERGSALLGPPPAEVFADVDRRRLLRSFADDVTWGLDQGLAGYAVLNACRALRFATDGGLYSKLEGGEWALAQGIGDPSLIAVALHRQRGAEETVDLAAAASFADDVRDTLVAAARRSE
jgi:streptomycin 3"-adenylyltransferase